MRRHAALAALFLLLAPAGLRAAGSPYEVRSPSAGVYRVTTDKEPRQTLIKGQVITVMSRSGEWVRIITGSGLEGWMRSGDVAPLGGETMIDETAADDSTEPGYYEFVVGPGGGNIRSEPSLKASRVRSARKGEILPIVGERGKWYQVTAGEAGVGWIHESVGLARETQDMAVRLQSLVEMRLGAYDLFKSEQALFRRLGWFPSFYLRDPEKDIEVEGDPAEAAAVTVHLACAGRDVERRMLIRGVDRLFLPEADRLFLADIVLAIAAFSERITRVRLRIWFAGLDEAGAFYFSDVGSLAVPGDTARSLPPGEGQADALWRALTENTLSPELWK